MSETRDGSVYVPYDQRTGGESIVYFTRDLSAAGLKKAYEKVNSVIHGKIAIKLHTGENEYSGHPRASVPDLQGHLSGVSRPGKNYQSIPAPKSCVPEL